MPNRIPHSDVVDYVDGQVFDGVTFTKAAGNLFSGTPDDWDSLDYPVIFVWSDGGVPPLPYLGTDTSSHEPLVMAEVITKARDEFALDKITAQLRAWLHGSVPSGYTVILATTTLGTRLQNDGQDRPRRQIHFRCLFDEALI